MKPITIIYIMMIYSEIYKKKSFMNISKEKIYFQKNINNFCIS